MEKQSIHSIIKTPEKLQELREQQLEKYCNRALELLKMPERASNETHQAKANNLMRIIGYYERMSGVSAWNLLLPGVKLWCEGDSPSDKGPYQDFHDGARRYYPN